MRLLVYIIAAMLFFGANYALAQVYKKVMGPTVFTGSVLAPDGSTTAPAYSFSSDADTGFIKESATGRMSFISDGVKRLTFFSTIFRLGSAGEFCFSSNADPNAAGCDSSLLRDRAGVLEIRDAVQLNCRTAAPASPVAGDMYCDSTANELCFYDGSAWQGISTGTDGNCS